MAGSTLLPDSPEQSPAQKSQSFSVDELRKYEKLQKEYRQGKHVPDSFSPEEMQSLENAKQRFNKINDSPYEADTQSPGETIENFKGAADPKDKLSLSVSGTTQIPEGEAQSMGGRLRSIFWRTKKRRAGTIGGALAGGGVVGLLMVLNIGGGAFEFIHIGQILTGPLSVFGHLNNNSDIRMGRVLYDIYKTGGTNFDAGNTRLNAVGRFLKKPILDSLEARGISPEFGTLKTFKGFTIDIDKLTASEGNAYSGMTREQAFEAIQNDFGDTKGLSINWTGDEAVPTKLFIGAEGLNGDSAAVKAVSNFISLRFLNGKLSSFIGSRVLMKYTMADGLFHPLRKLQIKAGEKVADAVAEWRANRDKGIKDGVDPSKIDASNAEEKTTTTDADGNTVTTTEPAAGANETLTPEIAKARLSGLKGGLGAAGIVATAVAIVCLLQTIDKNIGAIRWVQAMLPMAREAMDIITVASQVMSGKDVDTNELASLAKQFQTTDPKTGKVTSIWSDAAPLAAMAGSPGGIDLDSGTKSIFDGTPDWLRWTENGAVSSLCGTVGTVVTGVASVAIGVFSGGLAGTVIGLAAGAVAGPLVINFISNLLAGAVVDPSTLSGAQWGNVIAYGARLAGNAQALQYGGVSLTDQQVAELNASDTSASQAQFHTESIASRLFDPNDYRSVVGSMIDQIDMASGPQSLLSRLADIPALVGSLFRIPATLISATAGAAAPTYQYPFPEFGFSQEDMNNPLVQDPAANAKIAASLLDKNNNGEPDYIKRALDCFGVQITKGDSGWDAVASTENSSTGQNRADGVDAYDSNTYNQGDCVDSGDKDWLHIRFWIYDTRLTEAYGCYMGDNSSCDAVSFYGNASTADPTAAGTGSDIVWLDSGPGGEFDNIPNGGRDPITGYAGDWIGGQCSQASLAEVLNAYDQGKKLAGTAAGPSNYNKSKNDIYYKTIDVERQSYGLDVWQGQFLGTTDGSSTGPNASFQNSWAKEAAHFKMNIDFSDMSKAGSKLPQLKLDNETDAMNSLNALIDIANSGHPVITDAPNHWLVIWGGDKEGKYVYLLDSSPNALTYAPKQTTDSINISSTPYGTATKVSREAFIHGIVGYQNYWGGDPRGDRQNGQYPVNPMAVLLTPQ